MFNKTLIFFSPTMERTGSEIVLFNLLQNLPSDFKVRLVTKYPGVLLNLLPSNIEKDVLFKYPRNLFYKLINRFIRWFILPYKLSKYKKGSWYINTIILPEILQYAQKNNIRTILHTHELEQMFAFLDSKSIERLVEYPQLIIANSETSKKVASSFGRKKKIELCYPAINTAQVVKSRDVYLNYRQKLGISSDSFLWTMCGTLDKNKNPLLFLEVAFEIVKKYPNTRFMWIGNAADRSLKNLCEIKTEDLKLSENIIWMHNSKLDYYNYFNCADGFVLTSIKESFSLVTLEALLLELPIVAQGCEGVKEILRNDIGKIIDEKNNVKKISEEMIKYMEGEYLVDKEKGRERAKEFDISIWSKKWNQILIENV